jgi:hypothetical protein
VDELSFRCGQMPVRREAANVLPIIAGIRDSAVQLVSILGSVVLGSVPAGWRRCAAWTGPAGARRTARAASTRPARGTRQPAAAAWRGWPAASRAAPAGRRGTTAAAPTCQRAQTVANRKTSGRHIRRERESVPERSVILSSPGTGRPPHSPGLSQSGCSHAPRPDANRNTKVWHLARRDRKWPLDMGKSQTFALYVYM